MKKLTMMALSIIAIANLSGCATTETKEPAVKTEAAQPAEASKNEAVDKPQAETKATDTQNKAAQPTVGKRGFKAPNQKSSKPTDKGSNVCDPLTGVDTFGEPC